MTIPIIVADGHEVVRAGLVSLFCNSDFEVVTTAHSARGLLQQVSTHQPVCVMTDVFLGNDDGLKVIGQILAKSPTTKVVIFSAYDNPTYVARSHAWGAAEYLLKSLGQRQLIDALLQVVDGNSPTNMGLLANVQSSLKQNHINDVKLDIPLTLRESQVLRHLGYGLSNREIGFSMSISVETVKEHVQNVLRKLNFNDRTQVAVWAVRKKFI